MPNDPYDRYKFLKSMFHQAPLPDDQLDELVQLSERYNPKMAEYIKQNRGILF